MRFLKKLFFQVNLKDVDIRCHFEPAILKGTVSANVLIKMSEILEVPVSHFFDEVEPVLEPKDAEILDLQRKYIASLEKRLEEYEGKPAKKAS